MKSKTDESIGKGRPCVKAALKELGPIVSCCERIVGVCRAHGEGQGKMEAGLALMDFQLQCMKRCKAEWEADDRECGEDGCGECEPLEESLFQFRSWYGHMRLSVRKWLQEADVWEDREMTLCLFEDGLWLLSCIHDGMTELEDARQVDGVESLYGSLRGFHKEARRMLLDVGCVVKKGCGREERKRLVEACRPFLVMLCSLEDALSDMLPEDGEEWER